MKIANIFSFHKRSHTYRDTINKSCYDLNIVTRLCADRVTKILQVTIHIYRVAYYIDRVAKTLDRVTKKIKCLKSYKVLDPNFLNIYRDWLISIHIQL